MYSVSDLFKQYAAQSDREYDVKVMIGKTTYASNCITQFDITDSLVPSDDFTIGSVIASSLNISVKTSDTISSNAIVLPYMRLNGSSGYTEWIFLGVFYIDSRSYQNNIWTFSCFDKLIITQQDYTSALTFPAKMTDVLNEISTNLEITIDASVVINPKYFIRQLPTSCTYRDVISGIASAHGASVKLSIGNLKFIYFTSIAPVAKISATDYFTCSTTNPLKTYTKIVASPNQNDTDNDSNYIAGDVAASADNTLSFNSPYITQAMLNSLQSELTGFGYMPFTMDWKGLPYLEIGDTIQVTMKDGTVFTSTILINKLSFKGGLKYTTSAPSLSANKSEFSYGGTIKQYVQSTVDNAINKVSHMPNLVYNSSFSRFDENLSPDYWDTDGVVSTAYSAFGDYSLYLTNGQHCYQKSIMGNELCDGGKYPNLQTKYGFRFLGIGTVKVSVTVNGTAIPISDHSGNIEVEDDNGEVTGVNFNINDLYWRAAIDYIKIPANLQIMQLRFDITAGYAYIDGVMGNPSSEDIDALVFQDGKKTDNDTAYILTGSKTNAKIGDIWFTTG